MQMAGTVERSCNLAEIQSWWQVPTIAYFFSLYRLPFGLTDFEFEDLEDALVTDDCIEKGNNQFLANLHVELLRGMYRVKDITAENFEPYLSEALKISLQMGLIQKNPLADKAYSKLTTREKVEILHNLCDIRFEIGDVPQLLEDVHPDSMRLEPLGFDAEGRTFWYFYGTRLYREEKPSQTGHKANKKSKKRKKVDAKNKKKKGNLKKKKKAKGSLSDSEEKSESSSSSEHPSSDHADDEDENDEKQEVELEGKEEQEKLSQPLWSVVCSTEEEWQQLAESFKKSKHKDEKMLYETLSVDFVPEIGKMIEEKERRRKGQEKQEIQQRVAQVQQTISHWENCPTQDCPICHLIKQLGQKVAVSRLSKEVYKMTACPRGIALIININSFNPHQKTGDDSKEDVKEREQSVETRVGSEKDVEKLERLFSDLKFEVQTKQDLGETELLSTLKEMSKADHSEYDCFVLVLMSHGLRGDRILCSDGGIVHTGKALDLFNNENCKTLKGKPKLVFIEACRGEKLDILAVEPPKKQYKSTKNDEIDYEELPASTPHSDIPDDLGDPKAAHYLIFNSTVENFKAHRSIKEGSSFVRGLVKVFRKRCKEKSVTAMMTEVNNYVGKFVVLREDEDKTSLKCKQTSQFKSTLRKELFFL